MVWERKRAKASSRRRGSPAPRLPQMGRNSMSALSGVRDPYGDKVEAYSNPLWVDQGSKSSSRAPSNRSKKK